MNKDEIRKDFEQTYDGGYTFSEVENVILWAIEYGRRYERMLMKKFIDELEEGK